VLLLNRDIHDVWFIGFSARLHPGKEDAVSTVHKITLKHKCTTVKSHHCEPILYLEDTVNLRLMSFFMKFSNI